MQRSLYRILSVTALAWKLAVPAERETMVNGTSITDAVSCNQHMVCAAVRVTPIPDCKPSVFTRQERSVTAPRSRRVVFGAGDDSPYSASCVWLGSSNSSR